MKKYQVFENDTPADSAHTRVGKGMGWDSSIFDTKRDAEIYAYLWCYQCSLEDATKLAPVMNIGELYQMSLYEGGMQIKEIEVNWDLSDEIKKIAKELGFKKIVFGSKCLKNNNSTSAGFDYIFFGKIDDFDNALVSLFHEYGHCICNWKYKVDFMLRVELEQKCWLIAFHELKKRGYSLSEKQMLFAWECLSTYFEFEIRELSTKGLIEFQNEIHEFNRKKIGKKLRNMNNV